MSQKRLIVLGLAALLIVGMSSLLVVEAFACTQGCTPGFWKNPKHFDEWYCFSPTTTVGEALDPLNLWPSEFAFLKSKTLLQALQNKGASGWETELEKASRIYLRQAVATLLNTCHPGISSYNNIFGVRNEVRTAFLTLDPNIIEAHKNMLQGFNELGSPICD